MVYFLSVAIAEAETLESFENLRYKLGALSFSQGATWGRGGSLVRGFPLAPKTRRKQKHQHFAKGATDDQEAAFMYDEATQCEHYILIL